MGTKILFLICLLVLVALITPAQAFGAGNIASIAKIEGSNYRHGDIEDMLATVAHLKGYRWTSMMIKRVYFGNWLRDYSQAVDVGTLKGVQANAIRILVWILAFISFGYATREFEVTEERLGVYRPEEHIDNPEDYADNVDARKYDPRLRGPVHPDELAVDPETGMKNYIANDRGNWATSTGYVRFSFTRSIHYGRLFTSGAGNARGRQEDLFEALRCLGQGLHCLEDFGAHTNYCELALRELGFHNVFPHVGTATQMNLQGRQVFPLVTGTFGGVDFLHSVLGEAGDHITQTEISEVDQMKSNMAGASQQSASRGFDAQQQASGFTDLLSKVPGCGDLCQQAVQLQHASNAQRQENAARGVDDSTRDPSSEMDFQQPDHAPPSYEMHNPQWASDSKPGHSFAPPGAADLHPGQYAGTGNQQAPSFPPPPSAYGMQSEQQPMMSGGAPPSFAGPPGAASQPQQQGASSQPQQPSGALANIDLQATVNKIYPILEFRDNVVRAISSVVEKIPGLEKLIETISEKITLFIMGLLAPYIIPVINAASAQLKTGSSTVVKASAEHQYAPWTDPNCTAPTHSMLSKDHFSNTLNNPAGKVATAILQYAAPRIVYAWEHPGVPIEQVLDDIVGPAGAFHHPALRRHDREIHQKMFGAVQGWVDSLSDRGHALNDKLSSESVRHGKNHTAGAGGILGSGESSIPSIGGAAQHEDANISNLGGMGGIAGFGGHGSSSSGLGQFAGKLFSGIGGQSSGQSGGLGKLVGGAFGSREVGGGGEFDYGSIAPDTAQEGYSHAGQHLVPSYGAFGQEGAQSTYEAMQHRRSVSPYPEQQGGYEPPQPGQGSYGYEHQAPVGGGYEYGGGSGYPPQGGYDTQGGYGGGGGYPPQEGYGEQGGYGGGYGQYIPPGGHQGGYGAYPQ